MKTAFRCGMLLILTSALLASSALAQRPGSSSSDIPPGAYFRYTNHEGVRVLSHAIPPEFVANGYEIVSRTGQVLRVVEPVPQGEEADRQQEERRLAEEQARHDTELRRRYSTVADIEAAKRRSLAELQGNVSILRGNLSNVRGQIEQQESNAAAQERSGRPVSDEILNKLKELADEQRSIQQQIKQREQEVRDMSDRFDQDIERFRVISNNRS